MNISGTILLIGVLEMIGLALLAISGGGRVRQWIVGRRDRAVEDNAAEQCMIAVRDFHTRLVGLKAETGVGLPAAQRILVSQSIDAMMIALRDSTHEVAGQYRMNVAASAQLIRAFDAFSAVIQALPAQTDMAKAQPAAKAGGERMDIEKTLLLDPAAIDEPMDLPKTGPVAGIANIPALGGLDDEDPEPLTAEQMMAAMKNNDHEIAELQTELEVGGDTPGKNDLELTETQTKLNDSEPEIDYSNIPVLDNTKPGTKPTAGRQASMEPAGQSAETTTAIDEGQEPDATKDLDLAKQLSGLRKKQAKPNPEPDADPETMAADEILKSVEGMTDKASAAEVSKQA